MSVRTAQIIITGNASQAVGEIEKLSAKVGNYSSSMMNQFAAFGKKVALVTGAAATAVAAFSIKSALDYEKSHVRLMNAVSKTQEGMRGWSGTINMTNSQLEKFGFTNADTENSIARLVPVTKDQTQAMGLMTLAADIARARHLSLEAATQLLVKVQTGHVALLGRLGIQTKDLTGHTISQQQAIEMLAKMYGGSATREAKTFGGRIDVLKAQLTDLGAKIGAILIPIIEKMVAAIQTAIQWFQRHQTVAIALGVVIGTVLVGAMAAWVASVVIGAATAAAGFAVAVAGMVFNAAILIIAMLPIIGTIGLIVVAIAGLVAAGYFLVSNWDAVWNFIAHNPWMRAMEGILTMGISEVLRLIINHVDDLKAVWDAVFGAMAAVAGAAAGAVSAALRPIIGTLSTIVGLAHDALSAIGSLNPFGGLASVSSLQQQAFNKLQSQPSGPTGGTKRFHAAGGWATGWGVAGEAGPELINFGAGARVYSNSDSKALVSGGGDTYNVYVAGSVITERDLVDVVAEGLRRKSRRSGNQQI